MEYIATKNVKRALRLVDTVLSSRDRRMGQIIGEPGSGKTAISKALSQERGAMRVCAFDGISKAQVTRDLLEASGASLPRGTGYDMMSFCREVLPGRLFVIDEANHLKITHMERVRYFCDEMDCAAIFVGTPVLSKTLDAVSSKTLAKQLQGRIGSKRLVLERMEVREFAASIIVPVLGDIGPELSQTFHALAGGWWREGLELVEGAQRLMSANKLEAVTADVLLAAKQGGAL